MIMLLLGVAALLVLMWTLGMFSRAQVATLKQLGVWVVAIGGLLLAVLLFFTGRGATAIGALIMLGPLVWSWLGVSGGGAASGSGTAGRGSPPRAGPMTRAEAYEVLGLKPGATEDEIRAAHRRLMQAAHPDHGGSDWLAARVNLARDVLLS
jgi:DnaJ homolog subfamily C member 19